MRPLITHHPEQFSTSTSIMSKKYAQNKPRRVNMQARVASLARSHRLSTWSQSSPDAPAPQLVSTSTALFFVNTHALCSTAL